MDWEKIAWVAALAMMLPFAWRNARWWLANAPKPEQGDWTAALFALGAVACFVALLIAMV